MNRAQTIVLVLAAQTAAFAAGLFVNFETAPVHPIALSPSRKVLAACNLPDGYVELFEAHDDRTTRIGSVPVGLDPVTVRFRTEGELWVVNALSDSINVVDVEAQTVTRVISTQPRPADVVFAGDPPLAFVSCPPDNVVQVFNATNGTLTRTIEIEAERPRALAISPDGSKVYAAIFESGNGTTILAPRLTPLGQVTPAGPIDLPFGPYGGLNPPPNKGTALYPPLSTNLLGSNAPPLVSLIVKQQKNGRWLDDNQGDWTSLVSGSNAPFSGRVMGWNLADRDVAVIDVKTFAVSYIDRLMNICMDVAVDPRTGGLAVAGTDAINHVRYEPVLKSIFNRVQLALIQPTATNEPSIKDLNPHLDYIERSIPEDRRRQSIGDPRALVWNADGTRLYVAGMGSDNVVMLDATGNRLAVSGDLPDGPAGLVYDAGRNWLYVFCRFGATITILDAENLTIREKIPFFDPTPESIRKGRRHFYNTRKSSGLGQASCASCHIDARFDRLAWDLGAPDGEMTLISSNSHNFVSILPAGTNHFHPMKGPMATQTLQDIIGHEPFHWRGDRVGLEEFNATFTDLQGADEELTDEEMQEFEDFLATIRFPPNRLRNFDNSLPQQLPLNGHAALGRGQRFKGETLPNGNAVAGMNLFGANVLACTECHTFPTGNGPDRFFRNGRWTPIPVGSKGEHHIALASIPRSESLPFKVAQLRSLPDKLGFDLNGTSRAGFGLLHDGRTDTLTRFLQDGFGLTDDREAADLIAFLLSFSGSDLANNSNSNNERIAPGPPGQDMPAATGRQILLMQDSALLDPFLGRAQSSTGRLDLIVRARVANASRGWLYQPGTRQFKPDGDGSDVSRAQFFANLKRSPALFTLVPKGTGERLALDRDSDGALNYNEVVSGSDPADAESGPTTPKILSARVSAGRFEIVWSALANQRYTLWSKNRLSDAWMALLTHTTGSASITNAVAINPAAQAFFRIEVQPQ